MTENKDIPENLVIVRSFWEIRLCNVTCDQSLLSKTIGCNWSVEAFMEANFSKLTHNNQIFRNGFIFSHYHLCNISAQIIV